MHTEAAGVLKNVTIWTLNIINIVQENDKNFKDSMVILDNRFINFLPLKSNIEHMNWEYFIFGISQFVDKDKNNRNNTTGTFSGFRSSAFVSILFQLYFCISPNDDILPNIPKYKFTCNSKSIIVYNLLKIVKCTILIVLDVYFDLKKNIYNETDLTILQNKLYTMVDYVNSLWKIKQSLLHSDRKYHKSNNIHKVVHYPEYIRRRGNLIQQDTGTWKMAHKNLTKEIYKRTRKDKSVLYSNMLETAAIHHLHKYMTFANDCISLSYDDQIKPIGI